MLTIWKKNRPKKNSKGLKYICGFDTLNLVVTLFVFSIIFKDEREREVFLHGVETLTFHMSVLLELDKLNRPGQFTKSGLTSFLGCGYFQTHNFFI